MALLTIVVPSYNRSGLLAKTLQSLVHQSTKDFNVILIDHGSTDNTREIVNEFKDLLNLEYFWIEKVEHDPGHPRNYGANKVKTKFILFLDSGIVVPTFYVFSHIKFHLDNINHVGVGLYHGHKIDKEQDNRWSTILEQIDIDEAKIFLRQDVDLCDQRQNTKLNNNGFSWLYGWTGNLSMSTEDFLKVGGFDAEQKYGFEDLDLSYRLFKHNLTFAFVEDGWGIHLPHPRPQLEELQKLEYCGWQNSYWKYRSLALEIVQYTGINASKAEKAFRYLQQLGNDYADLAAPSPEMRRSFTRPSLLVGATIQDAPDYDYIAVSKEKVRSTNTIWSCCGILIPLSDHALETVVVTDMWKWLGVSFQVKGLSLLESLIAEIKRTAHVAYFMDSSQLPDRPEREIVSQDILVELCQKYDLPFQFLVDGKM